MCRCPNTNGELYWVNVCSTLQLLTSEVTRLAPQLLDSAASVVQHDVRQVEPLHVAAESWAMKVGESDVYFTL